MGKSLKHIFMFAATILAMLLLSCGPKKENSSSLTPSSEIALNASSRTEFQAKPSMNMEDSSNFDDFDYESTDLDEAEGRAFMIRGHENLDSLAY